MEAEEYGGEDAEKCIKFLLRELKKEWGRSGRTAETVTLKTPAARECLWQLVGRGILIGKEAEKQNLTFCNEMLAVKVCHIYLRISQKLKKELEGKKKDGSADECVVLELDEEEYAYFRPLYAERFEKHG